MDRIKCCYWDCPVPARRGHLGLPTLPLSSAHPPLFGCLRGWITGSHLWTWHEKCVSMPLIQYTSLLAHLKNYDESVKKKFCRYLRFFFQNCCVSISLLLHNLYFVHVWAQISAHDWLVEVINLITFCLAYHSLSDFNCHLSHGINIGFCICPCCLCYQFISAYHFCRLFMWAWPWLVDKDWESRGDCNVFWMFAHTRYRRSWVTRNCQ